jgi:streptogramin lyase
LPVTGASVQLYEAGASGNGSAATAQLASALSTDSTGSFTVPASYSCASESSVLYLVAEGGHSGSSSDNAALRLMAPVGTCGGITASTTVTLSEATTVASAYALVPFLSPGGNVGSSATNTTGLANAVVTAQTLVNMSTGTTPGADVPANVSVQTAKLNTLSNILSPCLATGNCAALLAAATPTGGSAPTNTLDAVLNIARHPGDRVTAVYALPAGTVFQPALAVAPADWTLAITFTGGGLDGPTGLGIDSKGDVWAVDYYGALSAFAPGGTPIFASGITGYGINESFAMAIDASDNVWTANQEVSGINSGHGTVSEFSSSGAPLSGALGYAAGGIYYPQALAADTDGSVWVVNYGNSTITHLTASGSAASGALTAASIEFPDAVAVDANHNAWVASETTSTITRISADGTQFTPVNCCDGAAGLAIDASGNIWSANYGGNSVSEVSSTDAVISTGYTGGGLDHPGGIAVDGGGTVWVANYRGGSFSEFAGAGSGAPGTALSPLQGFGTDANLLEPYAIAIDASGNVWVSNFAAVPAQGQMGTITQFVGLAAPVRTPLVGPVRIP